MPWSDEILGIITDDAEETLVKFEIRFGGNGNKGLHSIALSLLSGEDSAVREAVTWDADITFGSRHTFDVGDATKAITSGSRNNWYCILSKVSNSDYLLSVSSYRSFIK